VLDCDQLARRLRREQLVVGLADDVDRRTTERRGVGPQVAQLAVLAEDAGRRVA
jgi:hypothetical protein